MYSFMPIDRSPLVWTFATNINQKGSIYWEQKLFLRCQSDQPIPLVWLVKDVKGGD